MCVTSLLNMKNAQRTGKIANCINFPFEIILFIRCSLATICINNRIVDVTPPILYFCYISFDGYFTPFPTGWNSIYDMVSFLRFRVSFLAFLFARNVSFCPRWKFEKNSGKIHHPVDSSFDLVWHIFLTISRAWIAWNLSSCIPTIPFQKSSSYLVVSHNF